MNCIFYCKNKEFEEENQKYIEVRQNYLNIENKYTKNEKKIRIYCSKFNSAFNIFQNKYSLEEFVKYDGILYLCLLLEYNYQIICQLENIKEYNKDIITKIEKNIIEIIQFFNEYILNIKYIINLYEQMNNFFYQIVTTLKKYITMNNIKDDIFELIYQLINKIINLTKDDEDLDIANKIFEIKSKLCGLLHDILIISYKKSELNYCVIKNYVSIFYKLIEQGKLNDIYSNELIDEFLSFSFIFDGGIAIYKNDNDRKSLQNIYLNLLIKLLKHSKILCDKKYSQKISEEKNNKKQKKNQKVIIEKNNEYLEHYMEYAFQKIKFPDIFSNLLSAIYKADLISDMKSTHINYIKKILKEQKIIKVLFSIFVSKFY